MGVFHEAGEAIKDLFRHERITIIDENGNEVTKVVKPEPLQNPITLLRMLTWKACTYIRPCLSFYLSDPRSPLRDAHKTISLIPRVVLHRRFGLLDGRRL